MSIFWIIRAGELPSEQVCDGGHSYSIVGKYTSEKNAKAAAKKYQRNFDKNDTKELVEYIVKESDADAKYLAFIYDERLIFDKFEFWNKKRDNGWKKMNDNDYDKRLSSSDINLAEILSYKNNKGMWAGSIPLKVVKDSDAEDSDAEEDKEKH